MHTKQQKMAMAASKKVGEMKNDEKEAEYGSFCKRFPALLHSCGLLQSLAFANGKKFTAYLDHLAYVLELETRENLLKLSESSELTDYQRRTREAAQAANWLKRYAEALLKSADDI